MAPPARGADCMFPLKASAQYTRWESSAIDVARPSPDAMVMGVPPVTGILITVPILLAGPPPLLQYTCVALTAMAVGNDCIDASVVGVPPPMGMLNTGPAF